MPSAAVASHDDLDRLQWKLKMDGDIRNIVDLGEYWIGVESER